jgi:hypothetical protein
MTISESGSVSGPPSMETESIPSRRSLVAAILCFLGALILGGFGIAKTVAEYRQIQYLYAVLKIDQNAKDKIHRIWEGQPPGIVSALSAEGVVQSEIDDTERQIGEHRIQAWLGGGLIAGGVALVGVGIVLLRKRAKRIPIAIVNAAQENGVVEAGAESPIRAPAVAARKTPRQEFGAAMIAVGTVLAVIAVFVSLIVKSNTPSSVPAGDAAGTQPSAASAEPSTGSASSPEPAASLGSWHLTSNTNAVTGEVTTGATLDSPTDEAQSIVIRLTGKKLECYVNTNAFLETVDNVESHISTVQYKFDDGKVVRQGWLLSSDNEALFYPGNCAPFIAQLRKAKTLALEFRPSDKVPQTITFDVEGFPEGFKAGN